MTSFRWVRMIDWRTEGLRSWNHSLRSRGDWEGSRVWFRVKAKYPWARRIPGIFSTGHYIWRKREEWTFTPGEYKSEGGGEEEVAWRIWSRVVSCVNMNCVRASLIEASVEARMSPMDVAVRIPRRMMFIERYSTDRFNSWPSNWRRDRSWEAYGIWTNQTYLSRNTYS